MKAFQRRRILDQRFALTTPQNPFLDLRSSIERVEAAAAESQDPNAAPAPPPSRTPEEVVADIELASSLPFLKKLAAVENLLDGALPDLAPDPEIAAQPAPEPRTEETVAPVKESPKKPAPRRPAARRSYKRAASRSPRGLASRLPEPEPELTELERHARKCYICNHSRREEIEQDYLHWHRPRTISMDYDLPHYRYVYRHAYATGLRDLRRANMRAALEFIVEDAERSAPSADAVIRAVRACSRINERGEWQDPPSHVIVSSGGHVNVLAQRPTPQPLALTADSIKPAIEVELLPASEVSNQKEEPISNRRNCD